MDEASKVHRDTLARDLRHLELDPSLLEPILPDDAAFARRRALRREVESRHALGDAPIDGDGLSDLRVLRDERLPLGRREPQALDVRLDEDAPHATQAGLVGKKREVVERRSPKGTLALAIA